MTNAEALNDDSFQSRVDAWLFACFGEKIARDREERNHRFLEEALELVQAGGCSRSEALQLVDYVYGRPVGETHQEVGGVMNTLAALCSASGVNLNDAAEVELARVWTKVEAIRAKRAAKPKHSPLPEHTHPTAEPVVTDAMLDQATAAYVNSDRVAWRECMRDAIIAALRLNPQPTVTDDMAMAALRTRCWRRQQSDPDGGCACTRNCEEEWEEFPSDIADMKAAIEAALSLGENQ